MALSALVQQKSFGSAAKDSESIGDIDSVYLNGSRYRFFPWLL